MIFYMVYVSCHCYHLMLPLLLVYTVSFRQIFRPRTIEKFTVHLQLDENVSLLRIFPNITADTVRYNIRYTRVYKYLQGQEPKPN